MNSARPKASTMIAEQANRISCISRRSNLPAGIRSKKRIATSLAKLYSYPERKSGNSTAETFKPILVTSLIIYLTHFNLINVLRRRGPLVQILLWRADLCQFPTKVLRPAKRFQTVKAMHQKAGSRETGSSKLAGFQFTPHGIASTNVRYIIGVHLPMTMNQAMSI